MAPVSSKLLLLEEEEEDELTLAVAVAATAMKGKRGHSDRWWVYHIFQRQKRHEAYHHPVHESALDGDSFRYFRLAREQYAQVLYLIKPAGVRKLKFCTQECSMVWNQVTSGKLVLGVADTVIDDIVWLVSMRSYLPCPCLQLNCIVDPFSR